MGSRGTESGEGAGQTSSYLYLHIPSRTLQEVPIQETKETQVRPLGREDPLEKGMTIHSRIPAWRIPRTGELGGLQSIGSQRVWHDWSDLACMNEHTPFPTLSFLFCPKAVSEFPCLALAAFILIPPLLPSPCPCPLEILQEPALPGLPPQPPWKCCAQKSYPYSTPAIPPVRLQMGRVQAGQGWWGGEMWSRA